ncbi:MAG: PolC-type DNA polymerase III [Acidimicrobiales bacterium]|jgi:DNA polymerase-3 subunit epsilon
MTRPRLPRTPASATAAEYARATVGRGRTPWRRAHYCVVDLELTGLDSRKDEIISFGAVPIDAGRVVAGNAIYGLCRPTRPLPEESVLVHGIRTVDLADAAPVDEAIQPLIAAMTGRVFVAHVSWTERSFLAPVLRRQGVRLREPTLDTYELGRLLALERGNPLPSFSLSELAASLGLPVHRPHNALGDALTTAQVFIALATHLEEIAPETVRSLAIAKERARIYSGVSH